jgi:cation diffusion facilitator family transporter
MTDGTPRLGRFAWLSIAAAIATIGLKTTAWRITGSVGLLSDALESGVNLVAAVFTLCMLTLAERPPDEQHPYGHGKAEYFASAVEGALVLLAAVGIAWVATLRLLEPQPLADATLGVAISTLASGVNFAVARVLLRAGRRHHSIALEADAHHLMTDVWTSAGVLAGIGAVALTGWQRLDPIIALAVAVQIVRTGVSLVRRSALGLLDTALPEPEQDAVWAVLRRHEGAEVQFHALRTREAGARRFVTVHVLVPGGWTVSRGHAFVERLEEEIRAAVPRTTVLTHLEALEDPASFDDQVLDRDPTRSPRA